MDSQSHVLYREAGALVTAIIRALLGCYAPCGYETTSMGRILAIEYYRNRSNADRRRNTGSWYYHLHPHRKGEARIIYMQDYEVLNDKESTGIPAVYAIATLTDTRHDKYPITAQKFIHEQVRDLYCLQPSSTVGLPWSTHNYNRNGFLVHAAPINGALHKVFLTSLQLRLSYHLHYPTLVRHSDERCMYDLMRDEHH